MSAPTVKAVPDPNAAGSKGASGKSAKSSKATKANKSSKPKATSSGDKSRRGKRAPQYEARRVRRVLRHVDPWSVFKLSFIFNLCLWVIFVVAALIVWAIAESSGTVEQIEEFVEDLLNYDWRLNGNFIFREFGLLGLILTFAFTGMSVVGAVIFNLISDIVGGIWVTVIEEETKREVSS